MRLTAKLVILLSCVGILATTGCAYTPKMPKLGMPSLDSFPGVHKIDIQQGNVITQKMVDQLKPGMTKRQVQFVMGTPLIKDTFDQDRWDYVYTLKPGGETRQQESLSLYFEKDLLSHFEGDFAPEQTATP